MEAEQEFYIRSNSEGLREMVKKTNDGVNIYRRKVDDPQEIVEELSKIVKENNSVPLPTVTVDPLSL